MPTTFTLHAHEQTESGDSDTPAREMARAYDEAGVDLVGFVGHDSRPSVPEDLPVVTMTGTEHELQKRPRKLHVVDFPDQSLRILPHPSLTFPTDTAASAQQVAEQIDADAIESFNRGCKEVDPDAVDFPTLGNDDAHNTHQAASTASVADCRATPQCVARAVKQDRAQPVGGSYGRRNHLAGRFHQGINMLF